MGKLSKIISSFLAKPSKNQRIPIAGKFAHFRTISAANDDFLQRMTWLQEQLEGSNWLGINIDSMADALAADIESMVRSVIAMTGGTYQELLKRYEELDRDIRPLVPKPCGIGQAPAVVWPSDADGIDPRVVGPKSARLAEVALKTGLSIPPFFSVSACAYKTFMEQSGIQDLVHQQLSSLNPTDSGAIRHFVETLAEAFQDVAVPEEIQNALHSAYRKLLTLHPGMTGVAVRSSAVAEDSESSFAGQFDSILNVMESGLADAYKSVIASKYREGVLRYSIARGFFKEDIAMPVLVMAMVKPSSSGVAFSRSPDRSEGIMITAVRGLAQAMDSGKVIPDIVHVSGRPPQQVDISLGKFDFSLHCAVDGGLEEQKEILSSSGTPALEPEEARRIALAVQTLEDYFGSPQDVEWVIDKSGSMKIVQTRPLHIFEEGGASQPASQEIEGYRILARGARASGGVACGPIFHLTDFRALETVPDGTILCIPSTTPRIAGVMGRVRAIISSAGSPTGHMATVAREFDVPCIVDAEGALSESAEGAIVTVDGDAGIVYEGSVPELLQREGKNRIPNQHQDPMRQSLKPFLDRVVPLTLTQPDSPLFRAENCQTFHDIARFVHQKSMMEMFNLERLSPEERGAAHRLIWRAPLEVWLLDLDGGLAPDAGRNVSMGDIRSAPLLALIEGMTDPRLRWAGPVGFDLKGFMSVVVRSAADDQRYGEPTYCICAKDYVHFASRLAYHFATVDALCSRSVNENYLRFLFFGGAAIADRREWRASFLATVLRANQFSVKQTGDRVQGVLTKRNPEQIEEALAMLGRLMVAARHLDMVIESNAFAQALAEAFLSGDYTFEGVRRTGPYGPNSKANS
jgi:pyruvate, water dikinase